MSGNSIENVDSVLPFSKPSLQNQEYMVLENHHGTSCLLYAAIYGNSMLIPGNLALFLSHEIPSEMNLQRQKKPFGLELEH